MTYVERRELRVQGIYERGGPVTNATRWARLCDPGATCVREHASTRRVNTCRVPIATRDLADACRSTRTTTDSKGTRQMGSQPTYPGRSLPTAMLLAVTLGSCSNAQTPAPAPQVPEVSVITVHRGSVPITTELPGRTSAYL